jgi:hypothetical protein
MPSLGTMSTVLLRAKAFIGSLFDVRRYHIIMLVDTTYS